MICRSQRRKSQSAPKALAPCSGPGSVRNAQGSASGGHRVKDADNSVTLRSERSEWKAILAIAGATLWISLSEFVRNNVLLKQYWRDHYHAMGLEFPASPANGVIWVLWSLCFAVAIYVLSRRFTLAQTTLLAWFVGFALMWLVIGNLGVLPLDLLPWAVPLSLPEAFVATLIIRRLS